MTDRAAGSGRMSDTDSFIDEVTEEVRKDRLYQLMRRWGWLPVLIVLLLVGGTAWNEWRKAQERAVAQALGDAIVGAASTAAADERLAALRGVEDMAEGPAAAPIAFLEASAQLESGDLRGAIATLEPLATDSDLPAVYRDLAALRLVSFGADGTPLSIRADLIDRITMPGAPYRTLGLEQRALLEIEQGERAAAIATLQGLLLEDGVTDNMLGRVAQLLTALGADASSAGTQ